jgi:hypothetical protein
VAASGYQTTAKLQFGSITGLASTPSVVTARSRGLVSVAKVTTGFYNARFSSDVSSCTWIATAGNTAIGTSDWTATTRAPTAGLPNTDVGIVVWDSSGAQSDPSAVFVEVLCP